MLYPNTKIIVFAKTPVTGKVKTRLIPELGAQGAKQLHCRMIEHTLDVLTENTLAPIELHCTPDISDDYICQLGKHYNIPLKCQQGDDLGERMSNALDQSLHNSSHAILIGTDCPSISSAYIQKAIEILQNDNDVVIGPAEDGGYVLIGIKSNQPDIFTHIDWGTHQVLQQTRDQIHRQGLNLRELDILWDIDTPDDLIYLTNHQHWAHLLAN
ncbi:MAG: TIGR04282 family arsenosugar biosynthesis glycosyltransferase [Gammaproteobacteria bacterium]|nr:TIGR04282 family arsenosugar biosynthesis glycosyltransferase [Gammaproteobacteria bacterium]MCW9004448.1 TIGR04282 family arsenosugar biosynthesis glycosyltransferase [Gammaproteobacteria bacterium]